MRPSIEIHQADMRERVASIGEATVDLVLTDPPYGETSLPWDRWPAGWPQLMRRVLKPSGTMWVFGSLRMFFDNLADFDGFRFVQDVVWEKHNGSGFLVDRFRRVHEHACQFQLAGAPWADVYANPQFTNDARARVLRRKEKPAHWTGQRGPSSYRSEDGGPRLMRSVMYAASSHGNSDHPTQKPIEIVEPLLLYSCPPQGLILDPFAGSGTTGVVAQRHGRRAILIEANPKFAETCKRRVRDDAPLFRGAAE